MIWVEPNQVQRCRERKPINVSEEIRKLCEIDLKERSRENTHWSGVGIWSAVTGVTP